MGHCTWLHGTSCRCLQTQKCAVPWTCRALTCGQSFLKHVLLCCIFSRPCREPTTSRPSAAAEFRSVSHHCRNRHPSRLLGATPARLETSHCHVYCTSARSERLGLIQIRGQNLLVCVCWPQDSVIKFHGDVAIFHDAKLGVQNCARGAALSCPWSGAANSISVKLQESCVRTSGNSALRQSAHSFVLF